MTASHRIAARDTIALATIAATVFYSTGQQRRDGGGRGYRSGRRASGRIMGRRHQKKKSEQEIRRALGWYRFGFNPPPNK
jgi:hypothetical protein